MATFCTKPAGSVALPGSRTAHPDLLLQLLHCGLGIRQPKHRRNGYANTRAEPRQPHTYFHAQLLVADRRKQLVSSFDHVQLSVQLRPSGTTRSSSGISHPKLSNPLVTMA